MVSALARQPESQRLAVTPEERCGALALDLARDHADSTEEDRERGGERHGEQSLERNVDDRVVRNDLSDLVGAYRWEERARSEELR